MSENPFTDLEKIERWPAGEVVFREGEEPRGIFVLYSGRVDLIFSTRTGVKKPLRQAVAGDIVGLSDAVANTPHDCTAVTRTGVTLGFVPIAVLRRQLDETPSLWLTLAKYLSADLDACWASMRTLSAAR